VDSIASIFAKIAKAAAPLLHSLFKSFATDLQDLDKRLSQSKLNDFFKRSERPIRAFVDLVSALFTLLVNLGGSSAGSGVSMVERLTSAIDDVNKRFDDPAFRDRVKKFFDDAGKGFGDFAAAIGGLFSAIIENTDPKSLQKFATVIKDVLVP